MMFVGDEYNLNPGSILRVNRRVVLEVLSSKVYWSDRDIRFIGPGNILLLTAIQSLQVIKKMGMIYANKGPQIIEDDYSMMRIALVLAEDNRVDYVEICDDDVVVLKV